MAEKENGNKNDIIIVLLIVIILLIVYGFFKLFYQVPN
jgi:flagellar basal body-associated protein FliL